MLNPSICSYHLYYCECNKACEIDEYLDNCSCEKRLFAKIVLACEDQKLNTTEASLDDKKSNMCKNSFLIHTISSFTLFTLFHRQSYTYHS